MRGVVVVLLATGCNNLFGLDETRPYDAAPPRPDAVGCSGKAFIGPDELVEFNAVSSRIEFDFSERADGKEFWFSATESGGQTQDMYSATRAQIGAAWAAIAPASWNVKGFQDADSSMTDDGLRIVFTSDRSQRGLPRAWEVTRPSLAEPFGTPSLLRGIDDRIMNGLDLSPDGRTLYFSNSDDGFELHVAHRPTVDDLFVVERDDNDDPVVLATGAAYIGISPDELELFHNDGSANSALYRRVRASVTDKFGPQEVIVSNGSDAEISADSQRLYYANAGKVFLLHRTCP